MAVPVPQSAFDDWSQHALNLVSIGKLSALELFMSRCLNTPCLPIPSLP